MGSNPALVIISKYLECVFGFKYRPSAPPSLRPGFFFIILYIVQYLYAHLTSQKPHTTTTLLPLPPTIPRPDFFIFLFFAFPQLLPFLVHIHPDHPPRSDPDFFFAFSQLLQFLVHIHPDPPTAPNGPPSDFILHFYNNFNSGFTSTLIHPTGPYRLPRLDPRLICILTITSILGLHRMF